MTEKPTGTAPTIKVEVACAFPDRQYLIALQAPVGCTARQAVALAKLDALATELDLATAPLGIFGNALKDPDGTRSKRETGWRSTERCCWIPKRCAVSAPNGPSDAKAPRRAVCPPAKNPTRPLSRSEPPAGESKPRTGRRELALTVLGPLLLGGGAGFHAPALRPRRAGAPSWPVGVAGAR